MFFHELKRPAVPMSIRMCAQDYLRFASPETFSPGKAGALIGALNKICGDDENRRLVQGFLFFDVLGEPMTSKAFRPQHWNAISQWVDQRPTEDGWAAHPALETEIEWIMDVVKKEREHKQAKQMQFAEQKTYGTPEPEPEPVNDGLLHF